MTKILKGNGSGHFEAIPNREVGLMIEGEVRNMKTVDLADGSRVVAVARNNDDVLMMKY